MFPHKLLTFLHLQTFSTFAFLLSFKGSNTMTKRNTNKLFKSMQCKVHLFAFLYNLIPLNQHGYKSIKWSPNMMLSPMYSIRQKTIGWTYNSYQFCVPQYSNPFPLSLWQMKGKVYNSLKFMSFASCLLIATLLLSSSGLILDH